MEPKENHTKGKKEIIVEEKTHPKPTSKMKNPRTLELYSPSYSSKKDNMIRIKKKLVRMLVRKNQGMRMRMRRMTSLHIDKMSVRRVVV